VRLSVTFRTNVRRSYASLAGAIETWYAWAWQLSIIATKPHPPSRAHCPQDAAAIEDAALTTDKAEVERLKDEGMAGHEAGNYQESETLLADAMRRLLLV
jgi:hypothetical protein